MSRHAPSKPPPAPPTVEGMAPMSWYPDQTARDGAVEGGLSGESGPRRSVAPGGTLKSMKAQSVPPPAEPRARVSALVTVQQDEAPAQDTVVEDAPEASSPQSATRYSMTSRDGVAVEEVVFGPPPGATSTPERHTRRGRPSSRSQVTTAIKHSRK